MKEKIPGFLTGILLFLLLPYVITILINGMETALVNRRLDIEDCLPAFVSVQIPADYELEAVKAQTVIARSNLYRRIREEKSFAGVLEGLREMIQDFGDWWFFPDQVYEEAADQTEGQVLSCNGELKQVPYHELSSGTTRDGAEVFHDEEYSYLVSVDSSADKKSPDYLNSTYFSQQQMPKELTVDQRDSAGYVMSLLADGNTLEGEAFRQGMGLTSSDFTIQKVGDEYRFLCKGRGHGLGFSQYGGNEMAKKGSTYEEILETYFPAMELGLYDYQHQSIF